MRKQLSWQLSSDPDTILWPATPSTERERGGKKKSLPRSKGGVSSSIYHTPCCWRFTPHHSRTHENSPIPSLPRVGQMSFRLIWGARRIRHFRIGILRVCVGATQRGRILCQENPNYYFLMIKNKIKKIGSNHPSSGGWGSNFFSALAPVLRSLIASSALHTPMQNTWYRHWLRTGEGLRFTEQRTAAYIPAVVVVDLCATDNGPMAPRRSQQSHPWSPLRLAHDRYYMDIGVSFLCCSTHTTPTPTHLAPSFSLTHTHTRTHTHNDAFSGLAGGGGLSIYPLAFGKRLLMLSGM